MRKLANRNVLRLVIYINMIDEGDASMVDNKMIQEQQPPFGCSPDETMGPEIELVPDGAGSSGAFPSDQLDEDMPVGEPPSGAPVFSEAVPEAHELGEGPESAQEPEDGSRTEPVPSGLGTDTELLAEMERMSSAVSKMISGIAGELHELHRLYHNEFAGRLKSMQDELDRYHDADRGNAFDGILGAIARIYANNESLVNEVSDPKTRKNIKYMLLDLSDLLVEYGVSMLKSGVGDKRNVRHCQIVERIPTDNPELHDTIAASHGTGFCKGNRTIIKELVDVYFFDRKGSAVPEADADGEADADVHAEAE